MPAARKISLTRPPRSQDARSYGKPQESGVKRPPSPPLKGGGEKGGLTFGPRDEKENEGEPDLLATLKAGAERLTKPQRKELLDFVASLGLGDAGSTRDLDMWAQAAWAAFMDAVGTGGAGMAGPLALKGLLSARSAWTPVEAFTARVGIAELTVAERKSAYTLLARLLVERAQGVARSVHAPLTGKMIANNTGDIAAIFDSSFPGYASAGLGRFLFKRLVQEGLREEPDEEA